MTSLILAMLITPPANAGVRWKTFCEKYLVSDDPYPYAEFDSDYLIKLYRQRPIGDIRLELLYRVRQSMLTHEQSRELLEVLR